MLLLFSSSRQTSTLKLPVGTPELPPLLSSPLLLYVLRERIALARRVLVHCVRFEEPLLLLSFSPPLLLRKRASP